MACDSIILVLRSDTRLAFAFGASLIFHIVVIWPEPTARSGYPPAPLTARLHSHPLSPDKRAPMTPATPGQTFMKHASRAAAPATPEAPPTARDSSRQRQAANGTGSAGRNEVQRKPPSRREAESESAVAAPDPDAVREYLLALGRSARANRDYPAIAIARGWSGTVELSLRVGPRLPVAQIRVARSSGHAVLDAAALQMMGRAARNAALPDALRDRDVVVTLPVVFDLAETAAQ